MLSAPSMFNAPSAAASPAGYIQPTLNHGLRIWWAYYWPTNLITALFVFCAAFWVRKLYENLALSAHAASILLRILPYATTYVTAIFIFRYILGKRFRHFRIALLPSGSSAGIEALRPTWKRTIRVWWTFSWRSILYFVIAYFATTVSLGMLTGFLIALGRAMAVIVPLATTVLLSAAIGLFVIYSNILDEDFGDFRICLLPRETKVSETSSALPPAASPAAP